MWDMPMNEIQRYTSSRWKPLYKFYPSSGTVRNTDDVGVSESFVRWGNIAKTILTKSYQLLHTGLGIELCLPLTSRTSTLSPISADSPPYSSSPRLAPSKRWALVPLEKSSRGHWTAALKKRKLRWERGTVRKYCALWIHSRIFWEWYRAKIFLWFRVEKYE